MFSVYDEWARFFAASVDNDKRCIYNKDRNGRRPGAGKQALNGRASIVCDRKKKSG